LLLGLVRLNPDGHATTASTASAEQLCGSLVVQGDGKIVISGALRELRRSTQSTSLVLTQMDIDSGFDPNVDGPYFRWHYRLIGNRGRWRFSHVGGNRAR